MSVELKDNVQKFQTRFDELEKRSRYLLASQILGDANKHVRADTWALRDSSLEYSVPQEGLLVWNKPYAKRVYYTGTPSTDQNADAELMVIFKNLAEKEILK